jgi:type II secretory pathway pseudopilin PulG
MATHFHFHWARTTRRRPRRRGLSLLELLVVLTILIALGGIVISTLPGMLKRTQVATAAANIPEIDSTIRRSAMLSQGRIGNRFDSLISGAASLDGDIPAYIGGADAFQTASLSAAEVDALREVGITELVPASAETENATFSSHDQPPVAIGSDTRVCTLGSEIADTTLRRDWNLEPIEGAKYVVVGLGEQCSMVGAGPQAAFSEPPVHFSDDRDQSPEAMYSRYLLLIELKPVNESESVARYIGAAIPGRKGIHSVSRELENYYTDQN